MILGAVLPYFFLQFFDVGVQVARLVAAPYLLDRNCRLHLRYLRRIAAVVSAVVVSAVSGVDVSASAVHTATRNGRSSGRINPPCQLAYIFKCVLNLN